MKTLKVADMHCEMCVKRISNALTEAKIAFEVDLANQTVSVEESKVAEAVEELDDLGFEAVL
ncbi:heavy metal-associated domain-containing protein [Chakrabartyella piscis]|uniref:heavy-metal-associated domain-containing protein n=1 Tax=Chakrabartyella piscis TaxID=2918914 RepID=UPI002958B661|nr:heavy metal-associated domain-containing protein [Chakrabartyella piscis]